MTFFSRSFECGRRWGARPSPCGWPTAANQAAVAVASPLGLLLGSLGLLLVAGGLHSGIACITEVFEVSQVASGQVDISKWSPRYFFYGSDGLSKSL